MSLFLKAFEKQKYLNLETFRKSGEGVKTPVWFAEDGGRLRLWTETASGKVKRIRRDGKVRIVPSDYAGTPAGTWLDARAVIADSPEEMARTTQLFKAKYGLVFTLLAFMGKLVKRQVTTIQIHIPS